MASSKKSNYKGRSPNVIRCIKSCGSEVRISSLIAPNLAAGARLTAENQCQALDKKTARTHELWLIALENFAMANGDDAVLFVINRRIATTVIFLIPRSGNTFVKLNILAETTFEDSYFLCNSIYSS